MGVDVKYRTTATARGGHDGSARTEDGTFDVKMATPKELGGVGGEGKTPEQLFAAGYDVCFIGAMNVAAGPLKLRLPPEVAVTATVGIGPHSEGGFGLEVALVVHLPGLERPDAERLVEAAHQVCPDFNAARNKVVVRLSVAGCSHPGTTGRVDQFVKPR